MTRWPPMTPWRHLSFRASFCHLFWHGKQSQSNLIKFPSKISHLTYAFRDQVWFAIRFAQSPRLFTKMTSFGSAWVFFDSNFILRLLFTVARTITATFYGPHADEKFSIPDLSHDPNRPWPPNLRIQNLKIESIRNQPTRARHHVNNKLIFWPLDPDM